MDKMYSLNEIGLLPSASPSPINSRKLVTPYVLHKRSGRVKLPIFVSPMPCIVNKENYMVFEKSLVQPILPRDTDLQGRIDLCHKGYWVAMSLAEFKETYCKRTFTFNEYYQLKKHYEETGASDHVCIDMSDGHMKDLVNAVAKAKSQYGNWLVVMVGNIGHPDMYVKLSEVGADYVRVGIGGGNACTTSVLTGVHASLPWLLDNISAVKRIYSSVDYNWKWANVVADGGIDTIDKAIKCLALGADMVMMGKQFAQCEEACGETVIKCEWKMPERPFMGEFLSDYSTITSVTYRRYFGNASKEGQKALLGTDTKPSEGVSTLVEVNTTLEKYTKQFEDALRSCMSLTGKSSLKEFIGRVDWRPMSIEEFKSFYKGNEG